MWIAKILGKRRNTFKVTSNSDTWLDYTQGVKSYTVVREIVSSITSPTFSF